jgi:hypothetical protein
VVAHEDRDHDTVPHCAGAMLKSECHGLSGAYALEAALTTRASSATLQKGAR